MKYNILGNNGPKVSNICLGTWPIGGGMGKIEQKDAINAIHASIDNGVNFLDTAQMYLDSENILATERQIYWLFTILVILHFIYCCYAGYCIYVYTKVNKRGYKYTNT